MRRSLLFLAVCLLLASANPEAAAGQSATPLNSAITIISSPVLPNGTVNAAYGPVTVSAVGGFPPYSFSAQPPSGLTLSSTGVLSGTPLTAGKFNFSLLVTDSQGGQAQQSLSLTIIAPLAITTPSELPTGTAGASFSQAITATGGAPPYTFYAVPPAGLSLSSSGSLSGTPPAPGIFSFLVTVVDSLNNAAAKQFTIAVISPVVSSAPTITPAGFSIGTVGVPYGPVAISGTGGTPPYAISITPSIAALPPGLMFGAGVLSGTPTSGGTFSFGVRLVDAGGVQATETFSLTIAAGLTITTASPLAGGTAGLSYSATIAAAGGTPPYTFSSASLPSGLTISSNGSLSGAPAGAGTFSFSVTVTDSALISTTKTFQLSIAAGTALLQAAPTSLTFSASQGGDSPAAQGIAVLASGAAAADFSVVLDGGSPNSPAPSWLTVSPLLGVTPQRLIVSANQGSLPSGSYSGRIRILDSSNTPTDIAVTLTVSTQAPTLVVAPNILRFAALAQSSTMLEKVLTVSNSGGGDPVPIGVQVLGGSSWIAGVTPSAPAIAQNSPVFVAVSIDPQGLDVGRYNDVVRITSPAGNVDVPVILLITESAPIVDVSLLGLRFEAQQGSNSSTAQTLKVLNTGDPTSMVNWTAEVIQGGDFLTLNPAGGVATPSQPSVLSVSLTPGAAQANPGTYYALLQISAPNALNSPQYVVVVFDIASAGASPETAASPAGLFFVASGATAPAAQSISVNTTSLSAIPFQAGSSTSNGAAWLSVNPATGETSASNPGTVSVSINTAGLAAGIYYGEVDITISGALRAVNVVLTVQPAATTTTGSSTKPLDACAPSQLALAETAMTNNFAVPAGWPANLIVRLNNDCGQAVTNGQVVASFSNGDAPLSLKSDGQGNYSATWQPYSVSSQMQVTLRATAGSLQPAVFELLGSISQNQAPFLARNGTVHNLNPVSGAALAPGTIAQVYGAGLATGVATPNFLPLPPSFNGTSVLVGGFAAPLYYLSAGQLDVQIPNELQPNQTYSIVVSVNNALSVPDQIDIVPAMPGVAAYSNGELIAQHAADYSFVTTQSPARPGEYLIMYLAGMGATNPEVSSGQPAPSLEPLSRFMIQPNVTVDGQSANIGYAGLTPGAAGLDQINFQVPFNAHTGNLQVVITQNGQTANLTTLPVSQ